MTPGRLYAGSLVAISLIVALAVSWPAFLIVAALWLLIALALMWSDRGELQARAKKAEARAEVFADEIGERDREIAELDVECQRLHVELTEAQIAAGVVIPFPTRHHGASIELAALDAEATAYTWPAIARDAFPIPQWGEDADA